MKIGVVIVTYNRLEKLKIALSSYEDQTIKPVNIIVVNNNSNDGTTEYLERWKKERVGIEKRVINLSENIGGSGGFYEGLKASLGSDAEWIWVADDDAYPKPDAFELAQKYIEEYPDSKEDLSAICGTVLKSDGETIDYSHRRRIYTALNRVLQPYSKPSDYKKQQFEINGFSYVGTLINKTKLQQVGLPKKDYFIYYDDTDHGYRLSKVGKIICVPKMKIVHDAPHSDMGEIVKWKLYYLVRNALDFVRNNFDKKYFKEQCFEVPLKFKIAVFLYGKNKRDGYKMINDAVKDAKAGKTGLHDTYKPGWVPISRTGEGK